MRSLVQVREQSVIDRGLFWILDDEVLYERPNISQVPTQSGESAQATVLVNKFIRAESDLRQSSNDNDFPDGESLEGERLDGLASASTPKGKSRRHLMRLRAHPTQFCFAHFGGAVRVTYDVSYWLRACREPPNTDAFKQLIKLSSK